MKALNEFLNEGKIGLKKGDKVTAEVTKGQEATVTDVKLTQGMKIAGKRGESFYLVSIFWTDKKKGMMTWAGRPEKFTKV